MTPDCIWLKHRTAGEGWVSFWNTSAMGPTKFLGFNSTGAAATSSGEWNNTAPTNTVFTIGNQGRVNTNTHTYIAYCFHNVEGYCKVNSIVGLTDKVELPGLWFTVVFAQHGF